MLYQIIASTYEEGTPYPVVVHTFTGRSKKEAQGYFKAHCGTCSFFRDCTDKGEFRGFRCWTTVRERWVRP